MVGFFGVGLLLFAYVLLITKWAKYFIPVDAVASFLLTIHALMIKDIPFTIVNGFITGILITKFLKKETI